MKDYKIIKEWEFSTSKTFNVGRMECLNDDLAKQAMKDGYIENPNKKTKKIKKDGGANSSTNN